MSTIKKIRDTDLIQEAEVTLEGFTATADVKTALALVVRMRREAFKRLGVDEESSAGTVTSCKFRVEGDTVIAHVTQGLVE